MPLKPGARILAFDDTPFRRGVDRKTLVIGVMTRGPIVLEAVFKEEIQVDGIDSTQKICKIANSHPARDQAKLIILHGTVFGGLNVVNLRQLHEETARPVASIVLKPPSNIRLLAAARSILGSSSRIEAVLRAQPPFQKVFLRKRPIYVSYLGLEREEMIRVLRRLCILSSYPEPLRIACLIASALR
ncbi:MAG: hypothetical protein DRN99_08360 [Thermoproteota archaeon]|nr:MAG: hypothetical protein DRN99_08360 [Candidatus Korarchaeota archaeon]